MTDHEASNRARESREPNTMAVALPAPVIADAGLFQARLGLGDAALETLRARKNLSTFAEAMGVGTSASAITASATVASLLTPSSVGMAAAGAAVAATPLSWILGAGVLAGSAYVGIAKRLEKRTDSPQVYLDGVERPLDLIGVALLALMLPISQGFCSDHVQDAKVQAFLENYYVGEWGYDLGYFRRVKSMLAPQQVTAATEALVAALVTYADSEGDLHTPTLLSHFHAHLCGLLALQNAASPQWRALRTFENDMIEGLYGDLSRAARLKHGGARRLYALRAYSRSRISHKLSAIDRYLNEKLERFR